ncbi:MAG: apolipoprotein N-acyltransferase [Flavobacteriales bacterium]
MLKNIPNSILAILFSIFYIMAWTPFSQAYLIFIAFVPLLLLIRKHVDVKVKAKKTILLLVSLFFSTTIILNYWISYAHWGGTLLASIVQSLLLLTPFLFFYRYTKKGHPKQGILAFIFLFISIEYLQNFWDLSWPWFNLGQSLSVFPEGIQWYSYTGSIGGSLLILIINISIYTITISKNSFISIVIFNTILITVLCFILTPTRSTPNINQVKSMIYQPNLDAYSKKFDTNQHDQLKDLLQKIETLDTTVTTIIICPETYIHRSVNEDHIEYNPYINSIKSALKSERHYVLTGLNSTKKIDPKTEQDKGSIRTQNGIHYKVYNSALLINNKTTLDIYHKSKLVAGAETTPFSSILSPILGSLFNIDLGGISGNLGKSDSPKILTSPHFSLSPIICFESAFSDYTASFSELGSDFIAIITNDDWWGNTAGHKHHFELAKIRAIENQKYVVRSANTGISGIIAPNGTVVTSLSYKEKGFIEGNIGLIKRPSYFSQNKHVIGKLFTFVLAMLILQMETLIIRSKKNV